MCFAGESDTTKGESDGDDGSASDDDYDPNRPLKFSGPLPDSYTARRAILDGERNVSDDLDGFVEDDQTELEFTKRGVTTATATAGSGSGGGGGGTDESDGEYQPPTDGDIKSNRHATAEAGEGKTFSPAVRRPAAAATATVATNGMGWNMSGPAPLHQTLMAEQKRFRLQLRPNGRHASGSGSGGGGNGSAGSLAISIPRPSPPPAAFSAGGGSSSVAAAAASVAVPMPMAEEEDLNSEDDVDAEEDL